MTFYCTNCWKEIEYDRAVCPNCHAEQGLLAQETIVRKLIRALHHPEPETPIRAAYVLGELEAGQAVAELASLLFTQTDPFIAAACAQALGRIGGTDAYAALQRALNEQQSIIVKRAVHDALERLPKGEVIHE